MGTDEHQEKAFFMEKAESLLAQGFYRQAEELASQWLERYPGDAECRVILCHAWTRMGKLDKVKQTLKDVDAEILGISMIYARMGDICRHSGLNREAVTFYKRFVALNPHAGITRDVETNLAVLLNAAKEPILSEELAASQRPLPVMQTVTMAELYWKQGHRGIATEMLKGIIERDNANTRAIDLLARISGEDASSPAKKDEKSTGKHEGVIRELHRWLNNIPGMKAHAT